MINQKYILLILNCKKYRNKALKQKEGWLSKLNPEIKYFHVIGDYDKCNNKNYLFDYDESILYTATKDDYLSLPHKVIMALNAINETYNYKFIFKTDDDQELIKNIFFDSMIKILDGADVHYGGRILSVPDHYSTYYTVHSELPENLLLKKTTYCNGRFYFLSKPAVESLLTQRKQIKKHIIEDHAIGYYLDDQYKKKIMNIMSDNVFIDMK